MKRENGILRREVEELKRELASQKADGKDQSALIEKLKATIRDYQQLEKSRQEQVLRQEPVVVRTVEDQNLLGEWGETTMARWRAGNHALCERVAL